MRRLHRIVLLVGLLAPVLAGCADFDMDKLDIFGLNEKKKLPGDRKPVFPQGVPGVTQGIPPEYLKRNQPVDAAQTPGAEPANAAAAAPDGKATAPEPASKAAAVEPAEEPKPKPIRKPRATTNPLALGKPVQGQNGGQQQTAPWPDQNQPPPQQAQQGQAPWPSTPAPGTFSR